MTEPLHPRFALVGNRPALDFANTVHARRRNVDALQSATDVFDLLEQLELLPAGDLSRFRLRSEKFPVDAQTLLDLAVGFRGELRMWLGSAPKPPDPESPLARTINAILAAGAGREILKSVDGVWRLVTTPMEDTLTLALVPFARSAAELIAEGSAAPIRKCGNPRCPLYFYDTSRNGKRRWCSMESCGNQAKVRAHLDRKGHTHAAE